MTLAGSTPCAERAAQPAVQILDDSTDKGTRDLVDDKVAEWRERGVEVEVRRRTNRAGYKAGALHEVCTMLC